MQARMTLDKKSNNTCGEQNGSNIRKDVVKRAAKRNGKITKRAHTETYKLQNHTDVTIFSQLYGTVTHQYWMLFEHRPTQFFIPS
jgi:hypothetical protein